MRKFKINTKAKPILLPFVLTLVLVSGLLYFEKRTTNAQTTSSTWYMAGANPQRTSWISQDVTTVTGIEWYRPIEAYIDQGTQIVTGNGKIYMSTTKGLVVLDAENGDIKWKFDTEMPLGNAPTIIGDMVYVGGFDLTEFVIEKLNKLNK